MGLNKAVDFSTAKLLKEKGFDVPVHTFRLEGKYSDFVYEGFEDDYWGDNKVVNWNQDVIGIKPFKGFVSAPTIAEVVMWLYEGHGVWITSYPIGVGYYCYQIYSIKNRKNSKDNIVQNEKDSIQYDELFNSPTEAYEKAIEYTLKNLI